MAAFPDLTLDDSVVISAMSVAEDKQCTTEECQNCQIIIREKLLSVGLLQPDLMDLITSQTNMNQTCEKYRFSAENEKKEKKDSGSSESEEDSKEDSEEKKEKKKNREKRQITNTNIGAENIIGTRYTLSCTKKGITTDSTGAVSLCSACWVWRKLPDGYRPQFINELVCDVEVSCLSGYASCSPSQRLFDVIQTVNGVSSTVTLNAGSFCECKIMAGSALQTLVSGAGISGNFTPV